MSRQNKGESPKSAQDDGETVPLMSHTSVDYRSRSFASASQVPPSVSNASIVVQPVPTREAFMATLEETAQLVERLVGYVEGDDGSGPVAKDGDMPAITANLVFCADNLARIEETLQAAMQEDDEGETSADDGMVDVIKLLHRRADTSTTELQTRQENSTSDAAVMPTFVPEGGINEAHSNRRMSRMSLVSRGGHSENSGDVLVTRGGTRHKKKPKFTRRMIRWLAAAGFVWQILSLSLFMGLTQVWGQSDRKWINLILGALALFQLVHVITTIAIMYKIGMQIAHHTIAMETLLQSYLSTITAMAGIYFLFMAIDTKSFEGINAKWKDEAPDDKSVMQTAPENQIALLLHMFYFSCTVMTGCGFGDITPRAWYAVMCVSLEQLLSITYSTVIFGLALQHFTTRISLRKRALEKKAQEATGRMEQVDWNPVQD